MKDHDGRKIDRRVMEMIRLRAVERVAAGETVAAVARALGLSRSAVHNWVARHRTGGAEALASRSASGRPPKLDDVQLCRLLTMLAAGSPRDYALSEADLWTKAQVTALVKKHLAVELSGSSLDRLIRRLGIPTWTLLRRQCAPEVDGSVQPGNAQMRRGAKEGNAMLLFAGETTVHWKWGERDDGLPPPRLVTTVMYGVQQQLPHRFRLFEGEPSAHHRADFLRSLSRDLDDVGFCLVPGQEYEGWASGSGAVRLLRMRTRS